MKSIYPLRVAIALLFAVFASQAVFAANENETKHNGHEAVDLGLSVKWATMNVGAETPADYGYYISWGETDPKGAYDQQSCKLFGVQTDNIAPESGNDAARNNWGGEWRLPTKEECEELMSKCNSQTVTVGGHKAIKFTGPNGNSIIPPAAGFMYDGGFSSENNNVVIWTSTVGNDIYENLRAYCLNFNLGNKFISGIETYGRHYGCSIRPVIAR